MRVRERGRKAGGALTLTLSRWEREHGSIAEKVARGYAKKCLPGFGAPETIALRAAQCVLRTVLALPNWQGLLPCAAHLQGV